MNRIGTYLSADDAERVIASTKQAILNFKNSRKERKLSIEASPGQLQKAVESQHGGTIALASSVPLTETLEAVVWENVVHVFDLKGHPAASRAYAWSSPIEGSDKPGSSLGCIRDRLNRRWKVSERLSSRKAGLNELAWIHVPHVDFGRCRVDRLFSLEICRELRIRPRQLDAVYRQ